MKGSALAVLWIATFTLAASLFGESVQDRRLTEMLDATVLPRFEIAGPITAAEAVKRLRDELRSINPDLPRLPVMIARSYSNPEKSRTIAQLPALERVSGIEAIRYIAARSHLAWRVRDGKIHLLDPEDIPVAPRDKVLSMFMPGEPFSFDVLYGSSKAHQAIRSAKTIQLFRLTSEGMTGPAKITQETFAELKRLFVDEDTFDGPPACGRSPAVVARVTSGSVTLDLLFCFKCSDVEIVRNDRKLEDWSMDLRSSSILVSMKPHSCAAFLAIFQAVFPDDAELKSVKIE